ncbi:hypothetical protein CUJ89_22590 [Burkholderia pyrrocinia]|uniref:Type VI secretion system tip protein VgrG n=1 Tax=Burkholderia pyrrocinia TaxID=60550 RepID=A0A2Z5N3G8_BURPY|nr:type VI secretion system Vgr family protein [Burkholderia pyrrocinia]AXF23237.1 hypothetical protein CUJ89_22590 [Burkholderia pyrrocinia]
MAEADRTRTYLTGRQSAHLKLMPRKPQKTDQSGKPPPMPVVSVVSWEVHEEICKPYRIKAVVSTEGSVSRKKVLGQLAEFTIQPEDGRERRKFSGFVSRFDLISESRDGCIYRIVVRQRLAMLDGPSNCVTYQGMASWEIIKAILERHDIRFWMQVELRLRHEHPRHAFRFQYNMGDWAYIRLEMEQAGLFCFTTMGEHGEVLVIADDIDGYERPHVTVLDRPTAGLSTFEESIFSFKMRTRTVPESFVVADYNPESAWEILRDESQPDWDDPTMIGQPYVWGTHHGDAAGAKHEAQLRHEAALAQQVQYKVKSTVLELRPGRLVRSDRVLDDTKAGMFVTKVVHSGARDASYMNRFTAIPANRPYRMKIEESRWPRIHGTLGATICSPDKYKFAYLTDKGEYIARFHCDFGIWPKGVESAPLRLAKPFAGANHTGMHMPALDGDEALVGFREGNPNKPILVGFMPNSHRPDLINSSRRRMSRNEIRTQSGNKLWMDDWDNQQGIELSTEHSGRSQLNLGFIPDGDLKERGSGAELRTSGHLVGRGGAGAMLTAYNQAGGSGKVLAMDETDAQLTDHQAFARSLADSAGASKASPADLDAQQAIHDGLKALKKPGVLVTGPGPVGIASGNGVHVAADGSIVGTAKKGVHFSTLRRFTAAAGDLLSMFSQKGMSLITSAGDFVAQAQRGRMQLASQGDMTMETVDGVLHVKSSKEIVLNVGGSYLRMTPDGIEFGSRGGAKFKTSSFSKAGPAQMNLGGAAFAPVFVPYSTQCEVWRTNPDFASSPASAPDASQWEGLANSGAVQPAPPAAASNTTPVTPTEVQQDATAPSTSTNSSSSTGGFFSRLFDRSTIHVNDPANAPKDIKLPRDSDGKDGNNYVTDPIQLVNPAPCNWTMSNFNGEYDQDMETMAYYPWTNEQTKYIPRPGDPWSISGGKGHAKFDVKYDDTTKTLTAFVKIGVILKDIYEIDPVSKDVKLTNGTSKSIPYHSTNNGANAPSSAKVNLKFVDRETTTFKFSEKENFIRNTLNQNSYKLILDGCSKDVACGCRIEIKFDVKFVVLKSSEENAPGYARIIKLYPYAARDDSGNWGEIGATFDPTAREYDLFGTDYTPAHECGHLFNFPDEYYSDGGAVHEQYIDNEQLQFAKGHALDGTLTWQMISRGNLMGLGARNKVETGAKPVIPPYYMEYLRRWMTKYTNKKWRVGSSNVCRKDDASPL